MQAPPTTAQGKLHCFLTGSLDFPFLPKQGLPFTILEDASIAPYITLLKEEELAAPEPIVPDEAADAAQAAADGGAAAAAAAADEGVPVVPPPAAEEEGPAPMVE